MQPRPQPSHTWVLRLLQKLGYPTSGDGACYGIAVMGMQAIFAGTLEKFDDQLSLLNKYLNDFGGPEGLAVNIRDIERKRIDAIKKFRKELFINLKLKEDISDEMFHSLLLQRKDDPFVRKYREQCINVDKNELDPAQYGLASNLMDVRALLDGVALHHTPYRHPEIFDKNAVPRFQSAELTFPLVLPDSLLRDAKAEEKGSLPLKKPLIEKIHTSVGLYNLDELTEYFKLLTPPADIRPPPVFLLTSSDHAISVTYDSDKKKWLLIDAEKLPSSLCPVDAIAGEVLSSFSRNNVTTFRTEMFCHTDTAQDVHKWLSEITKDAWTRLHDVKGKEIKTDSHNTSLLYIAANAGDINTLRSLLECETPKVDINQAAENGVTPLMVAAQYGHLDILRELLLKKDPNLDVNKALNVATENGDINIIKELLLSKYPNLDVNKALYTAAKLGHTHIVRELLLCNDPKVNVNQPNADGMTPLMVTAQQGHADVVRELIQSKDHNVNVNQAVAAGSTALHVAAKLGHVDVVKELLQSTNPKVNINQANQSGFTPLYFAITSSHKEIVHELILNGCDVYQKINGQNALQLAKSLGLNHKNNREIMAALGAGIPSASDTIEKIRLDIQGIINRATALTGTYAPKEAMNLAKKPGIIMDDAGHLKKVPDKIKIIWDLINDSESTLSDAAKLIKVQTIVKNETSRWVVRLSNLMDTIGCKEFYDKFKEDEEYANAEVKHAVVFHAKEPVDYSLSGSKDSLWSSQGQAYNQHQEVKQNSAQNPVTTNSEGPKKNDDAFSEEPESLRSGQRRNSRDF